MLLSSIPVALTCGFYDGQLIADPAAEEEALLATTVSTVLDAEGRILGAPAVLIVKSSRRTVHLARNAVACPTL